MKFILPLLSTMLLPAMAVRNLLAAMKPEEVQDLVDRARMTKGFDPNLAMRAGRSHESEDCETTEAMYYQQTAIAAADFVTFLFSFQWTDPSFDVEGFFDNMNFSTECAAMGGEVFEADFDFGCPDIGLDESSLKGYKFCKPTSCNDVEWVLTKKMIALILGTFAGCSSIDVVTHIDNEIPSVMCLMGMEEMYNSTELVTPESFLVEGGLEYAEDQRGVCKAYGKPQEMDSVKVCDMTAPVFEEEYSNITSVCNLAGGTIYPLDITAQAPFMLRTVRRYPFCKHQTCNDADVKNYYDFISTFFTEEHGEDIDDGQEMPFLSAIEFKKSLVNSCDETVFHRASMKKVDGEVVAKTCKWLKKRKADVKDKFCKKKNGLGGYKSASEVCPSTCCSCQEDGDNIFLKKMSMDNDGEIKIETRTCEWLQNAPSKAKETQCSKEESSYVGGYPPAYVACPETCGGCNA